MTINEQAINLSDGDLLKLIEIIAVGKNKDERWKSFNDSELYGAFSFNLTKSDFLVKGGLERIVREFIEVDGADASLRLLRSYLKRGWVYDFDKPAPAENKAGVGLGVAFVLGLLFGCFVGFYFADDTPDTIFKAKISYKENDFSSYEEKYLYDEVKLKPSKDIAGNLSGYRHLVELNPNKDLYSKKVKLYVEKEKGVKRASQSSSSNRSSENYSSSGNGYSESEAKNSCQSRIMVEEPDISRMCSTRSCISQEVASRFGRCMRSYGYSR